MCYFVITASAYTSAGPLSLKQNGVFTFVMTSGCIDLHTPHISPTFSVQLALQQVVVSRHPMYRQLSGQFDQPHNLVVIRLAHFETYNSHGALAVFV